MLRAKESGLLKGFLTSRGRIRVSHLQFANDTIFFSKAYMEELQNLKLIMLVFEKLSGLKINLDKSTLSKINISQGLIISLASMLEQKVLDWPWTYLGLPLGGNAKAIVFWDPMIDKVLRRLDGWKRLFCLKGIEVL